MSRSSQKHVRVRFAPSPTGHLHIGGLRTALFNYLFARHHDGAFLIRIEDTDVERSNKEFADSILASFSWADITPDEPVLTQSNRAQEHKELINQLLEQGNAYKCYCTADELVARCSKDPKNENFFIKYDGYCRDRTIAAKEHEKPYTIRFALPKECTSITFDDLIRGPVTFDSDQLDDFIIARSDGSPIYNFVVVADDIHMRITHIIRGEEHISNTPKQILLYEALKEPVPYFAHTPMILGPSGEKLSKRDGAVSVLDYKKAGYLPEALINYLVRLGWSHGDQEIFTRQELIEYFTLEGVGKKGAIFDLEKLNWVNSVYLKAMGDGALLDYIRATILPHLKELISWSDARMCAVIALYKERVNTIRELADYLVLAYTGPQTFDSKELMQWVGRDIRILLEELSSIVQGLSASFNVDEITAAIKTFAREKNVSLAKLAQPLRIALVGKSGGPGVFGLLAAVGKQETIRRIDVLLAAAA